MSTGFVDKQCLASSDSVQRNSEPKRMLVAYSMLSTFTSTTAEYLDALKRFSGFEVDYIHVTHDSFIDFDINKYDVIFHSYCSRFCFEGYVSSSYEQALHRFLGLKMLAVQDEYDLTATLHKAIRRLGFHVFFTCVPEKFWPLVYPKSELPGLTLKHVLTGYVPANIDRHQKYIKPLSERSRKIVYRGRDIGARYGQLGFEKFEVGRRMAEICDQRGITHDIAMTEESRIYGDKWFEFVGDSRTMLGSESGSNAFDFDGTLRTAIADFEKPLKRTASYSEAAHIVQPFEQPFDIGQISPRVFECAAMRTPMILMRGGYSGAIQPDVHYIPLEKDFSNADAILARIGDIDWLSGFADRAHAKLVQSGDYNYTSFIKLIDETARSEYKARIDGNFIAYRRSTMPAWAPLPSDPPVTHEEAKRLAFREVPTEKPLAMDDYRQRADRFAKLSATVATQAALNIPVRSPIESLQPVTIAQRIADVNETSPAAVATRSIWRKIPIGLRDRIKRAAIGE